MHPDNSSLALTPDFTPVVTGPLPWKRNEGHPGAGCVLASFRPCKTRPYPRGPSKRMQNQEETDGVDREHDTHAFQPLA